MGIIERMPNWLRYILALPFGILWLYVGYIIGYISNIYIASPDSLMMTTYNFLYQNGINIMVMFTAMNVMLPKHRFQFTLTSSIIYCGLAFVGLGMTIVMGNITIWDIIGLILIVATCIGYCIYTYKNLEEEKKEDKQ